MERGSLMRALENDDEQIVVAPSTSSSLVFLGGGSHVEINEKNHLRLAFGCEGGGDGGSRVEMTKMTTSGSRLDAREVVVVADGQKNHLQLAFEHEGGGVVAGRRNGRRNHLRLAFGREGGGGGGGGRSKQSKKPPPARV